MPRKLPPLGFITAGEAAKRLGVSDGMLSIYVRQGKLKRYGPEERKHKFYKESEVQAIEASDNAFFGVDKAKRADTATPVEKEKNNTVFMRATPDDMEEVYE